MCLCMQEALDELATWLDAHPKEIVVISCSHFEFLTDEDHIDLVEFIIMLFGKKLCSSQVTGLVKKSHFLSHVKRLLLPGSKM